MAGIDWNYNQAVIDSRSPTQDLADTDAMYDHDTLTPYGGSTPGSGDDLYILGTTMPTSNSGITALHSWDSSGVTPLASTSIASLVTSGITVSNGVVVGVSGDISSNHHWNGPISGGDVLIQGASTYSLHSSDTPANVTIIDSGVIDLGGDATLGSLTINGASTRFFFSGDQTIIITGVFALTNAQQTNSAGFHSGTFTLNGTSTIAGSTSIGSISGLLLNGSGTLAVSGTTSLASGTLTIGGSLSVSLSGMPNFTAGHLTINTSGDLAVHDTINVTGFTITACGGISIDDTVTWNNSVTACTGLNVGGNGNIQSGTFSAISGSISLTNSGEISGGTLTASALVLANGAMISGGSITCSGGLTVNDTATITGGTISCTTVDLVSSKAINGGTLNNSGSLTGSQSGTGPQINSPFIRSLCGGKGK